jgi:hypothetical protein
VSHAKKFLRFYLTGGRLPAAHETQTRKEQQMANWYYYNDKNEKIGPIRGRELNALAQQGTITPETVVETEDGKKATASQVKGLTFGGTVATGQNPFMTPLPAAENPFTVSFSGVNRTTPKSATTPVVEKSDRSSWQITFVVIILLLMVMGIIYWATMSGTAPQVQTEPEIQSQQNNITQENGEQGKKINILRVNPKAPKQKNNQDLDGTHRVNESLRKSFEPEVKKEKNIFQRIFFP